MRSIEILPGIHVTNDKCLVLDDGPTVVIGDLHLGYERALEDEGMYIPRINTTNVIDRLNDILCQYEPSKVILLGDIKHTFRRSKWEEGKDVKAIIELIREASDVVVVRGNHDNYIQNAIQGTDVIVTDHMDQSGFRMEHGHIDSGVRPVIIGHEHPSVRILDSVGVGMKLPVFVHAREDGVIVLPAFSAFSSGNDLMADRNCIMADALKKSDYINADLYGISDLGIISLGKLKDFHEKA